MSAPTFTLNVEPLIAGLGALFNSVIEGVVAVLPTIGAVVATGFAIALMLSVAERLPVVGGVIGRVRSYLSGLF